MRHRGKIEAVLNNARRAQELVAHEGSLAAFVWRYEPQPQATPQHASISEASTALSKDLKKLGWKFVEPTTMHAFMQAMGLINDHAQGCVIRPKAERARGVQAARALRRPDFAGAWRRGFCLVHNTQVSRARRLWKVGRTRSDN